MTDKNLVESAFELTTIVRENLAAGEERARLVPEVVSALGGAGFFRLYAPREVGGLEVTPATAIAVMEIIASADPAAGWYMANSIPACLIAASLQERERAELFSEPNSYFGNSAAAMGRAIVVDGGYELSGEWPVVTGCEDATWCALAGLVMEGEAPRMVGPYPDGRLFLVRTNDAIISQTWKNAAAMRGSGSNALSVKNLFVSESFSYSPMKPRVIDRPLYRLPFSIVFGSCPPAIVLGVLRSALDSAADALSTKVSSISGRVLREQAPVQELIAECNGALRAARAGLMEASAAIWDCASSGGDVSARLRAELHASAFHACETGREMVSRLYTRGTRAAFMQGNPVERALRNIHAMAFTLENGRNLHHDAGRVLMGGQPTEPGF